MTTKFKIGDHVGWNSEAGHFSGHIIGGHSLKSEFKAHPRHCRSTTRNTKSRGQNRSFRHAKGRGAPEDVSRIARLRWRYDLG